MGWIEFEALRFFCPERGDVFVGCKSSECLESPGEVISVHEVGEMFSEVFVGFVIEAFDGSFFESSVHALDLAVGPGMFRLGQSVVDVVLSAGELEGMGHEDFSPLHGQLDFGRGRAGVSGRSEMGSVIGKHGVDLVGDGFKQGAVTNASDQARAATIISYFPDHRRDAVAVRSALKAGAIEPIDDTTRAIVCPDAANCDASVVVTVGSDLPR